MLYVTNGNEQEDFRAFIEHAIGVLSTEDYTTFLSLFDCSRLSEQDLILALKYLDETRPVLKVDDPALVKKGCQDVCLLPYNDASGYCMDYDLTTNGAENDLTIQVEFLKEADGYRVILEDLHTL